MTFLNNKNRHKKRLLVLGAIALTVTSLSALPANAATKAATPKPTVSGAPGGGFGSGANAGAFAKYTACLAKAGIKLPAFGGRRGFGNPGTRPSGAPNFGGQNGGANGGANGGTVGGTPRPRPTFSLTPAQQKAFAACASLRPSFGGFNPDGGGVRPDGRGGGINPGAIAPGTTKLGGSSSAPSTSKAPKTGTSAAYIACLNTHGIPVTSAAQIAGLDSQNPKVAAALKACAGK
jgi:hypothetical protein